MDIRTRLTRREVLVGFASGAALVVAWPASISASTTFATADQAATGPVTLDEFMDLSRVLTDDVAKLRDEVGGQGTGDEVAMPRQLAEKPRPCAHRLAGHRKRWSRSRLSCVNNIELCREFRNTKRWCCGSNTTCSVRFI